VLNGIVSLEDIVPTIMAAAGVPNVKNSSLTVIRLATNTSASKFTMQLPTSRRRLDLQAGRAVRAVRHHYRAAGTAEAII
jgi:arylsulfatase A-like enzyme